MSDKPSIDLQTRARWQRWEMESLESRRTRLGRQEADQDAHQIQAHRAETLRRQAETLARAREEGMAKGYEAGFAQGHTEGHAQGLETGLAEGHAQGQEAGQTEGHAQGLETGLAEGRAQIQEQAARLDALAQACAQALNQIEEEVGQSLIQLATRIAGQVLRGQLRNHPDHILDLVQDVLQSRPEPGAPLTLRLNPDDHDLVQTFLSQDPDASHYRLIADERITRGGCVAETTLGSVDATLETRWQRIISALGQSPRPL